MIRTWVQSFAVVLVLIDQRHERLDRFAHDMRRRSHVRRTAGLRPDCLAGRDSNNAYGGNIDR